MKAFPTPTFSINDEARVTAVGGEGGMDLRDYFAAQAMQGLLSDGVGSLSDEELADWAYKLADAMMKARQP
jgi:hypothetical protein